MTRAADAAGFSLVELIVALGLTLVLTAAVFDLIGQARRRFEHDPVRVERVQRARVAVDALSRDLMAARVVLPYRAWGPAADPPGSFRHDVLTLVIPGPGGEEDTVRGYYLRRDPGSDGWRLMRGEGEVDAPVVDGVTTMTLEYEGDAAGPVPGEAGSACTSAGSSGALAAIDAGELSDGPWCPSAGVGAFDADLLRLRAVTITLGLAGGRGDLRFTVAPRNRNQER